MLAKPKLEKRKTYDMVKALETKITLQASEIAALTNELDEIRGDQILEEDPPKLQNSKSFRKWTKQEVCKWLESKDLGRYAAKFESEGVDGKLLAELDEEMMQELGISTKLHRRKLAIEMAELESVALTPQSVRSNVGGYEVDEDSEFSDISRVQMPIHRHTQSLRYPPGWNHKQSPTDSAKGFQLGGNLVHIPFIVVKDIVITHTLDRSPLGILKQGTKVQIASIRQSSTPDGLIVKRAVIMHPTVGKCWMQLGSDIFIVQEKRSKQIEALSPRRMKVPRQAPQASISPDPIYEFDGDSVMSVEAWRSDSGNRVIKVSRPSPTRRTPDNSAIAMQNQNLAADPVMSNHLHQEAPPPTFTPEVGGDFLFGHPTTVPKMDRNVSVPGVYDWDEASNAGTPVPGSTSSFAKFLTDDIII